MDEKDAKHSNSGDSALFREAVSDAVPLKTRKRHPRPVKPGKAIARKRREDEAAVRQELLQPPPIDADIETGEELQFWRDGVNMATQRKLKRGQLSIRAEIDLHGRKKSEAITELYAFITESVRRGHRCIRVVHGKGRGSGSRGPVLKTAVNSCLRNWDDVLAFCSAQPAHGGTGAIYVLLRAQRK